MEIDATMKSIARIACLFGAWFSGYAHAGPTGGAAQDFACGGALESRVWQLWSGNASGFMSQALITDRLEKKGDTYALYDLQTHLHNLVAMAVRCGRSDRLLEIAQLLSPTYAGLEPAPGATPGRAWICRGGGICNDRNRLVNTEVSLTTQQFLGLLSAVALPLASRDDDSSRRFVRDTVSVLKDHFVRYSSSEAVAGLARKLGAQPSDVKDGSSALFFTDKELWLLSSYANFAGIVVAGGASGKDVLADRSALDGMRRHFEVLLRLFNERVSYETAVDREGQRVSMADLDRGFWRRYADSWYAGYTGTAKPVECAPGSGGAAGGRIDVRVPADGISLVEDIGWDVSHGRRLVHALDAIDTNRVAIQKVFGFTAGQLPRADIQRAFANRIAIRVWNGDRKLPLFSNYLSGANGWYRVAYDNGTGQCVEGTPPYGLSSAFPTGGYATWGALVPALSIAGRRLYDLASSGDAEDQAFLRANYRDLVAPQQSVQGMLFRLAFWPSLVSRN